MDTQGDAHKTSRLSGSSLEYGLLAVSLVVLALVAGAVGWTIGYGATGESAVAATSASTETRSTAALAGDPVAGKAVFVDFGCSSCHTFAAASASGTGGPNLDQVNLSVSEVLDWVTNGEGAMPSFKGQVSKKQLADLAAFVAR